METTTSLLALSRYNLARRQSALFVALLYYSPYIFASRCWIYPPFLSVGRRSGGRKHLVAEMIFSWSCFSVKGFHRAARSFLNHGFSISCLPNIFLHFVTLCWNGLVCTCVFSKGLRQTERVIADLHQWWLENKTSLDFFSFFAGELIPSSTCLFRRGCGPMASSLYANGMMQRVHELCN
ncbi:hypothetical protein VTN02DRAFT_3956 [Thermoascus thermophilus]